MRGHTGPSGRFAEFALQYRQQANALIEPGCRRLVGSGRVVAYPDITPLRGSFRGCLSTARSRHGVTSTMV